MPVSEISQLPRSTRIPAFQVSMQWSEMEATLEADVALTRSQLNAMPIWDPDLQMRLRQQGTAGFQFWPPR